MREITKRALLREYLKHNFNNILQVNSLIRAVILFGMYPILWLFCTMWVFVGVLVICVLVFTLFCIVCTIFVFLFCIVSVMYILICY